MENLQVVIDSIETYVRSQIDSKIDQIAAVLLKIIIPYMVIITLLRVITYYKFYQFSKLRYKVVDLLYQVNRQSYESYSNYLSRLINQIEELKISFIRNYNFDIIKVDQSIYHYSLKQRELS